MTTVAPEPAAAPASGNDSSVRKGLLRFSTAGSVDDGKSTLIGRLLYDSRSVYEDQMASVAKSKINRSSGPIDFSLLTDGLRAEREQGITIDVAYRYFSTPRRKFIIADTPGHEQYTRNMATGASTADAAVVLIDAGKGVLRQSRRHAYIASLLGVQHIIAAVNKMDLVAYSQEVFERIVAEFRQLAERLGPATVYAVPVSALEGDNVVHRSARMPWFSGPSLLEYLEQVAVQEKSESSPLRFPVQYVIRPDSAFRGFSGQVASGVLRPGAEVMALPSRVKTRVKSIATFDGDLQAAGPQSSVTVTLEDEIDLSRGDMLAVESELPAVSAEFRATLVWMHGDRLDLHKDYLLKHTTRTVRARIRQVRHRVDVNTLDHAPAASLEMNDIGVVDIRSALPLYFDAYQENHATGSFILMDPISNATVAAGIIASSADVGGPLHGLKSKGRVEGIERTRRFGHPPAAVWLGGRLGVAELVERVLFDEGWQVQLAGPSDFRTDELAAVAKAFRMAGTVAIFSPASDTGNQQQAVRAIFGREAFFTLEPANENDKQAAARILAQVRQWRDAQEGLWREEE